MAGISMYIFLGFKGKHQNATALIIKKFGIPKNAIFSRNEGDYLRSFKKNSVKAGTPLKIL